MTGISKCLLLLDLSLTTAQTALAAEQFRARRARKWDERASEGRCEIRVWVDEEVNIFLEGDLVTFESPGVRGLYPVGEGAGYAGGIVSSALDGMRAAEQVGRHLTCTD